MKKAAATKKHLYLVIADALTEQIKHGIYKSGDKLPSVRSLCSSYHVSINTAQMAYYTLISRSLAEARPKSGYFVSGWLGNNFELPQTSKPQLKYTGETDDALVSKVFETMSLRNTTRFSSGTPSVELLPIAQLNKMLSLALKELSGCGTEYEKIEGNEELRKQIAQWSYFTGARFSDTDIVTTSGCLNAVAYCLMALTQRGDTIAVESPVFFGLLQLFRSLGLKTIELPSNASTGIEIEALKRTLTTHKINVCLLNSNFSNPLGSCMPEEHKKEVVRLLNYHHIPLIEDDIYGDLHFGPTRPKTCKAFDEEGLVLYCSSVSKTLAPGYRVGWVVPGKFKKDIVKLKMVQSFTSTTLTQQTVANFFKTGKYGTYMRKLRNILHTNSLQYTQAIAQYFPNDTKISRPRGGLFLWVELNKKHNTLTLFNRALQHNIAIVPGKIFTLQNQFNNCMRLSYGLPWSKHIENQLKLLARLIN